MLQKNCLVLLNTDIALTCSSLIYVNASGFVGVMHLLCMQVLLGLSGLFGFFTYASKS